VVETDERKMDKQGESRTKRQVYILTMSCENPRYSCNKNENSLKTHSSGNYNTKVLVSACKGAATSAQHYLSACF